MLLVFIPLYISLNLAIGFWASKKVKTTADFTLAGKSLSTAFVGVTLFATWFGASQVMGNPSYFVADGFSSFVTLTLSGGLCLIVVAYFYAKKLYTLNLVTVGDFFQKRYSKRMDTTISLLLIVSYPPWIAAQFLALAFLFQSIFGLPVFYGVFLGAGIVILYTYIGGMWAVSYTDMLQSVLIVIGLLFLLYSILNETGGIAPIFEGKPESFYSFFPINTLENWSEYLATFLALSIGAIPAQEIYQRVFSAKSSKAAISGLYLGGFLMILIPSIPMIIGLGAAHLHPDLMEINEGQNIIPMMVSQFSNTAIKILFFGALISAILSTSSGAMLAPATIIGENLVKPNFPKINDKKLLLMTRVSVLVVAVISCLFAFKDSNIVNLVVISLSLIMVCIFAPFTFGLFWKKSSIFGAWASIIFGAITFGFTFILETVIDPTIYGLIASCMAMVIGSLYRPEKNEHPMYSQIKLNSSDTNISSNT